MFMCKPVIEVHLERVPLYKHVRSITAINGLRWVLFWGKHFVHGLAALSEPPYLEQSDRFGAYIQGPQRDYIDPPRGTLEY